MFTWGCIFGLMVHKWGLKNQILEKESEELRKQIEESNQGNKPSIKFLTMFGAIFTFVLLSLTSLIGSIINKTFYRPVKVWTIVFKMCSEKLLQLT